jgi:hypothetical protein
MFVGLSITKPSDLNSEFNYYPYRNCNSIVKSIEEGSHEIQVTKNDNIIPASNKKKKMWFMTSWLETHGLSLHYYKLQLWVPMTMEVFFKIIIIIII